MNEINYPIQWRELSLLNYFTHKWRRSREKEEFMSFLMVLGQSDLK